MAGKPSKPMTPFDKSVTPSYLYKWKLFLAFLPPSIQRFLAVYIKFTEFRYTMDYFRGLPFHAFSFQSISELAPYMDENERDMMNQMTSVMQMAEMMAMAQAGSTTGDPGALLAPTEGTRAASACISPSIFSSGAISLANLVASTTLSTTSCFAEPLVEKLNIATFGSSIPATACAVRAVQTAI